MSSWDETLRYYQDELGYLRRAGEEFAKQYPKIAGRLELTPEGSADPHVDRMISSFAFLTARIQRQLHGEFPEISTALLGALHPQLVNPVPPMAIARFDTDPDQGKITTGFNIPRQTALFAQSSTGQTCRFRTCYDVTLWPLTVMSARFESPAQFDFLDSHRDVAGVLRLQLAPQSGLLSELELKNLRFHLNGESTTVNGLYELLFSHVLKVALLPEGSRTPVWLDTNALRAGGFSPEEEVIPCPPNSLPGYRLIQEYFLFPQKFHFLDIYGLERHGSQRLLDILILLDQLPADRIQLRRSTFLLGCTPIINLFKKTTEPIRLDQRQFEYRLVGDYRKERTTEIHSITSVSASSNPAEPTTRVEPFFSHRHRLDGREGRSWWYSRRVPTEREDLPGTDILMSFVDLDFDPALPPHQVVYAHALCMNRDFATQLPAGAALQIEDTAPLLGISCLNKPTAPVYPPLGGATLWQLVSNLSLNFLSFSSGQESLEAFREVLRLYSFSDQPVVFQQIQGISDLSTRQVTRRIGRDGWRGFCHGTEVTLTFDESLYVGTGSFLLAAVLNHYFALYASINSFTELVVRSRQRADIWKRWEPMAGYQPLV